MYFSYKSALRMVERCLPEFCRGRYKAAIFFLGTIFDAEFQRDVLELMHDLDRVTGQHVLAIAFLPPPPAELTFIRRGFLRTMGMIRAKDVKWEGCRKADYELAMTKNTYDMADLFGVSYEELPGLLVLNPEDISEICWVSLKGSSLRDLFPDVRAILSDWYSENQTLIKEAVLCKKIQEANAPEVVLKRNCHEAVCKEICSTVIRDLSLTIGPVRKEESGLAARLRKQLRRVEENPHYIHDLKYFLKVHKLELILEKRRVMPADIPLYFAEEIRRAAAAKEMEIFGQLPECAMILGKAISRAKAVKRTTKWLGKHVKLQDILTDIAKLGIGAAVKALQIRFGGVAKS